MFIRLQGLVFILIIGLTVPGWAQKGKRDWMSLQKMERIFKKEADSVDGEEGIWEISYQGRMLLVITDAANNRMRIFSPIRESSSLDREELHILLEANFHTALDAKYSLWEGFVISVFTHPLRELTEVQLIDAMQQVATLANNYGTTYSSTDMIFAPNVPEEEEKRINKSPRGKTKKS